VCWRSREHYLPCRTLLTDAIREPQVRAASCHGQRSDRLAQATWESSLAQLQSDPRFQYSSLSLSHRRHLFQSHVSQLRAKHLDNLHALFLSNAPSLATHFTALPVSSLLSSLPGTKLGYDVFKLEQEFDTWQLTRTTGAREAFNDMLHENSFVEFWGRLRKIGGEGAEGGVKRDDDGDEEEGEGGGGNVDMKKLAGNVDITEMEKVLKVRTALSAKDIYQLYVLGRQAVHNVRPRSGTERTMVAGTYLGKEQRGCILTACGT
jgi:hypothetical protein